MMKVKFNAAQEFLEELQADHASGLVFRRLVRLTNVYTTSSISPNIKHVSVAASYIVKHPDDLQLAELMRDCGDVWNIPESDKTTLERADQVQAKVKQACDSLGLEVRAGLYDVGRMPKPCAGDPAVM